MSNMNRRSAWIVVYDARVSFFLFTLVPFSLPFLSLFPQGWGPKHSLAWGNTRREKKNSGSWERALECCGCGRIGQNLPELPP